MAMRCMAAAQRAKIKTHGSGRSIFPKLIVLAGIHAFFALLPTEEWALTIGMIVAFGYLAVLSLITRDYVHAFERLHPFDQAVAPLSGLLAFLLIILMFLGFTIYIDSEYGEKNLISTNVMLGLVVQFMFEVGFILCICCLCLPKRVEHIPPRFFWKLSSLILLIINGAYLFFMTFVPKTFNTGVNS
jgi:inner membrane protein involved in colicin E2 resistance